MIIDMSLTDFEIVLTWESIIDALLEDDFGHRDGNKDNPVRKFIKGLNPMC
jgi:hypothetical protein